MGALPDTPLALYIHWPFCVSKCPYCDFNSHVRAQIDQAVWRNALLADLAHEAQASQGRTLGSIFFGGGTPSLMPPATAAALIDAAGRHWRLAADVEITLEANPGSVEAACFADLAHAGVNRVSLGIQALEAEALRFLGRAHDVGEALSALETAQAHFDRVSIDLIYARPHQQPQEWQAELARALSFGTGHLSLYQLTIEPGTRFATLAAQGKLRPLDDDRAADLFALTRAMTASAGLPAYEISNHARASEESRHNLTYWRYGDYCGIGPGAHGRRNRTATLRHKKPENWLSAVQHNGHGLQQEDVLSGRDRAIEALLMGLRLKEGVDLDWLSRLTGIAPARLVALPAVNALIDQDLMGRSAGRLWVEEPGFGVLDSLLAQIIPL